MSTVLGVYAYLHKDEEFKKHKKILLKCKANGCDLPGKTAAYFGTKEPCRDVLEHKLEVRLEADNHYIECDSDEEDPGIIIYVSQLPDGITKLKIVTT